VEQASDEAWAANETERSGKHLVPPEIIESQIDEDLSDEPEDVEWRPT
jgi:hypothetical protein